MTADGPAADADLDAARALALAARRFDRPAYASAARRLGAALLREQTARAVGTTVLVAGPWAREERGDQPRRTSRRAPTRRCARSTATAAGRRCGGRARGCCRALLDPRPAGLPPDWAKVLPWGVVPVGPPGRRRRRPAPPTATTRCGCRSATPSRAAPPSARWRRARGRRCTDRRSRPAATSPPSRRSTAARPRPAPTRRRWSARPARRARRTTRATPAPAIGCSTAPPSWRRASPPTTAPPGSRSAASC